MPWNSEQILALAPDSASAKAGKGLASPRKWTALGKNAASAWGLCQGSGKEPYQTRIDLSEPAFKCSCPSRKFPCKHGLGLFLLLAEQDACFKESSPPDWVLEWLTSRQQRGEKKAEKAQVEAEKAADPEVQARRAAEQAKRAAKRQENALAGLEDLERWLRDIVRQGLASLQGKSYGFYETPAARLVDAQVPGFARMLRELAGMSSEGERWQERILERLGLLYLLLQGYRRMDALESMHRADVRALAGWTVSQEEVLAGEAVADRWIVAGQRTLEEDKLRILRTWLWGSHTARTALVLSFAAPGQSLDHSLAPGSAVEGDLCFYPSAYPLRALLKTRRGVEPQAGLPKVSADIAAAVAGYAGALAKLPWLEEYPVYLSAVVPERDGESWWLRDDEGACLPLASARGEGWVLRALSGGMSIRLFGEWNGASLSALGAWSEGRYVRCVS